MVTEFFVPLNFAPVASVSSLTCLSHLDPRGAHIRDRGHLCRRLRQKLAQAPKVGPGLKGQGIPGL